MCQETKEPGKKPENCPEDPAECSPEQIRQCHGDAAEHPCEQEARDEEK